MAAREVAMDLAIGMAAGFIATKVTDRAQRALWKATPEQEKAREPDMEVSSARSAAELLCDWFGIEANEEEIKRLKSGIHYGLGAGWGSLYGVLRRYSRMTPIGAGLVTGTSLSLIIDEAINPALGITPPSRAYPASAHVRGLMTHFVFGLAVAGAAEGLHRLTRHRDHWLPEDERAEGDGSGDGSSGGRPQLELRRAGG